MPGSDNQHHDVLRRIHEKLDRLYTMLIGNGRPQDGLVWRVTDIEQKNADRQRRIAKRERILWTVIGALVTSVIGWGVSTLASNSSHNNGSQPPPQAATAADTENP